MKLLGWMHSKLKQKGNEPANNTIIAVYKEVKSNGAEMEPFDELFPGFLAIGTLGNYQTTNTDPPTPTFPMPFDHGETDITEKELKFINDELEKYLEEKVNKVAYESSESIITLSENHIETGATECYRNMEEYPLQKYLLGSSIELPEIEAEVQQQKGFIEELFTPKNIVQEGHVGNHDGKVKKQAKRKHAVDFMKKMLQNLQCKSKGSTTEHSKGNVNGSVSSKRKLPQVLKMFKRKVHPEGLMNENIPQDNETSNISCKTNNLGANSEVNKKNSPAAAPKKELNALTVNREHWIKTDSDYLVLEL
ncbi:PREDICTED: protein LAZY 1-like isoform X2 [Nicotiana attenuata]|uniref:protein LAZY 1-like isoform X2 n=1 Tax=Nicotiana attenuata TaxID=49451 RepID=UPI000905834B|nr:PREDICTED: protein LAZY 1-like isoform X2 [Nicotiana attenuata]